ncbi:hypothetical protein [Paludibacterium sp. B53371]|uniref:hypothetical protein n=1 Tax=Paludibacterium sp. B53371 TaxID=2806263 RepID=UPI001C04293D|nr:hypothetical protein [Paludibacterium sp. B53371]
MKEAASQAIGTENTSHRCQQHLQGLIDRIVTASYSQHDMESLLGQGKQYLELLCSLLAKGGIPQDERARLLIDLGDNVQACGPGAFSALYRTCEALSLRLSGLPGEVQKIKEQITDQCCQVFAERYFGHLDAYPYNEVHIVNALKNRLAPSIGLSICGEVFSNVWQAQLNDELINECLEALLTRLHPGAVAWQLAGQVQEKLKAALTPAHAGCLDEEQLAAIRQETSIDLEMSDVTRLDEDYMPAGVPPDPSLITRRILRQMAGNCFPAEAYPEVHLVKWSQNQASTTLVAQADVFWCQDALSGDARNSQPRPLQVADLNQLVQALDAGREHPLHSALRRYLPQMVDQLIEHAPPDDLLAMPAALLRDPACLTRFLCRLGPERAHQYLQRQPGSELTYVEDGQRYLPALLAVLKSGRHAGLEDTCLNLYRQLAEAGEGGWLQSHCHSLMASQVTLYAKFMDMLQQAEASHASWVAPCLVYPGLSLLQPRLLGCWQAPKTPQETALLQLYAQFCAQLCQMGRLNQKSLTSYLLPTADDAWPIATRAQARLHAAWVRQKLQLIVPDVAKALPPVRLNAEQWQSLLSESQPRLAREVAEVLVDMKRRSELDVPRLTSWLAQGVRQLLTSSLPQDFSHYADLLTTLLHDKVLRPDQLCALIGATERPLLLEDLLFRNSFPGNIKRFGELLRQLSSRGLLADEQVAKALQLDVAYCRALRNGPSARLVEYCQVLLAIDTEPAQALLKGVLEPWRDGSNPRVRALQTGDIGVMDLYRKMERKEAEQRQAAGLLR